MLSRRDDATVSVPSFLKVFSLFFRPFSLCVCVWYFSESLDQLLLLQVMQRIYTYPLPNGWKAIVEILIYNAVTVILRKNTFNYSFHSFLNKYILLTNDSSHRMQDLANSL